MVGSVIIPTGIGITIAVVFVTAIVANVEGVDVGGVVVLDAVAAVVAVVTVAWVVAFCLGDIVCIVGLVCDVGTDVIMDNFVNTVDASELLQIAHGSRVLVAHQPLMHAIQHVRELVAQIIVVNLIIYVVGVNGSVVIVIEEMRHGTMLSEVIARDMRNKGIIYVNIGITLRHCALAVASSNTNIHRLVCLMTQWRVVCIIGRTPSAGACGALT